MSLVSERLSLVSQLDARSHGVLTVAILCGTGVAPPKLVFTNARGTKWDALNCSHRLKDIGYSKELDRFYAIDIKENVYGIDVTQSPVKLCSADKMNPYIRHYYTLEIRQTSPKKFEYNLYLVVTDMGTVYQVHRKIKKK